MHECIADGYSLVGLIGGVDMGWMWWNRRIAKRNKIVANPQLEFSWSESFALGCTTSAESDGNEGREGGEKKEIGALKFDKPCKLRFHLFILHFIAKVQVFAKAEIGLKHAINVDGHIRWEG